VPELRTDPLTGRWILVAADRSRRPNDFSTPGGICPFCPGNEAETPPPVLVVGQRTGADWQIRVTPNKFPAVTVEGPAYGVHEVIVEAPEHDLPFTDFGPQRFLAVLEVYEQRLRMLKSNPRLQYAFLFKNHGEGAGASRIHPHSQLIALEQTPEQVRVELQAAEEHFSRRGCCYYCEALSQDAQVVLETQAMVAICPSAARFPFETWITPKRHASQFESSAELAEALHGALQKLLRVTGLAAYNLGLHVGPLQAGELAYFHWRLEIIPRLSRLAGFELGTGVYIHEIRPEQAVAALRGA
jgi:UDPglucose--hexose-1-phosphate uridylyltransferase